MALPNVRLEVRTAVGALTTGRLDRIRRQGVAIMVAVAVWGAPIVAFGPVRSVWIALVVLAVAGWADVLSAMLHTTVLQTHAGVALGSRTASVQMAVVEGGPRLGGFESGALLIGAVFPDFRRYRRPESQENSGAA
jgi:hypothetical protein